MSGLGGLVPLLLIALVFWFLIVRPQRRRQQALVATCTVASLEDETVHVELSPGVS